MNQAQAVPKARPDVWAGDRPIISECASPRRSQWRRWSGIAQRVRFDLSTILYHSLLWPMSSLPPGRAFQVARKVGRTKYRFTAEKAGRLRREMSLGLGTTPEQSDELATRVYEQALWEDLESHFYARIHRESVQRFIEIRGIEKLNAVLAKGKGAILCTGHIRGLFTFIIALDLMGYKVNVIRRAPRGIQGPVGRWFNQRMTLIGSGRCKYLWMHENNLGVAVQAGSALRRQELVIVLIDARFGSETHDARLLQQTLPLPTGHIILAQACAVPLINFFVHSSEKGLPRIAELDEPYYPTSDVATCTQHCVSRLERNILKSPADWMWYQERDVWSTPVPTTCPKTWSSPRNCDLEPS